MELGANRRSLLQLAAALAVLASVVHYQFFRTPAAPPATARSATPRTAAAGVEQARPQSASPPVARGGRFQPRLGKPEERTAPDPLTADVRLRGDLLERVRSIEAPAIDRDIFNFGRPPKPAPVPPTADEARLAQERLNAALKKPKPAPPKPAPRPQAARARPPAWKYYGVAGKPGTERRRAFLLDGEEILAADEGSILRERFRIARVDPDRIVLEDLEANQEHSIRLEAPR